jgi:hypothetical protein
MTALPLEAIVLRPHISVCSSSDDALTANSARLEKDRDEILSLLREFDKQLVSARREEMDMDFHHELCPGRQQIHLSNRARVDAQEARRGPGY